jgi:uncharacterized protein (DUF952 family)
MTWKKFDRCADPACSAEHQRHGKIRSAFEVQPIEARRRAGEQIGVAAEGRRLRIIFKICRASEWAQAERAGRFEGSPIDLRDGYIHFSTAEQVVATAATHFAGVGDLKLVAVDADALAAAVKWEPSRGGALFPHLYGPLPLANVLWVKALPLDSVGRHVFPELWTGRPA